MKLFISDTLWNILIPVIIVGIFGVIVLAVILVKRKIPSLQIKKDEIPEEEAAREELDRVLVPVEEELQEQVVEETKVDEQTKD